MNKNPPSAFWRLLGEDFKPEDWIEGIGHAISKLAQVPIPSSLKSAPSELTDWILQEGPFGVDRWKLNRSKRIYYQLIRPILPAFLRAPLRTLFLSKQRKGFALNWPIEDRYAKFQFEIIARLLELKQREFFRYLHFWPAGRRFSFVLTHDVEGMRGQRFVRAIAEIEEKYGFRSSFNFIPERYHVDHRLLTELRQRGFEVGVHGLKHDGRLFLSQSVFDERAKKINTYLKDWQAVGFRAPMMHRNADWMQVLELEYDLSYFDTDPFEPIPGGTMSIWPFQLGAFIELPYTLAQDHTLMITLGQTTPKIWAEKVSFIESYCGMALVNTHPDYLADPKHFGIYEEFLRIMQAHSGYWHALPRDVARWWRKRSTFDVPYDSNNKSTLPGDETDITIGRIRLTPAPGADTSVVLETSC